MYQDEKEEAKRLQGGGKPRKDEEMAWPDWEEARKMEDGLVGLCWKEALQVVVRNLWRKVRLETTKQAVGRANRRKF